MMKLKDFDIVQDELLGKGSALLISRRALSLIHI